MTTRSQRILLGLAAFGLSLLSFRPVPTLAAKLDLTISPDRPTVAAGSTVDFKVTAMNPDTGTSWDVSAFAAITVTDPAGTITGRTYTAGRAGQWDVRAVYNEVSDETSVTVAPGPIDHLVVNPNSEPEVVPLGTSRDFTVTAFDAKNNAVPNPPVTLRVEGNVGSITPAGRFTASRNGNGILVAESGTVRARISVTVRKAVSDIPIPTATTPANGNSNGNVNAANGNVNGSILGEEDDGAATTAEAAERTCLDLRWWGWLLVLVAGLLLLYGYYILVRSTDSPWIWAVPIPLITALLVIFFVYRCGSTASWFPWILVIAALLVTLFRPLRFVPKNGTSL